MFRIKFPWFIAELDAAIGELLPQLLICMQQIFFEEILFEIWPDYFFFCIQFSNMTGCWFPFFTISDLIQSHLFLPFMHFFNIIKYLFSSAVLFSLHHHCCSSAYLFFPQQEVEKLSHSIQKFVLQDMENLTNGYFLLFFLQVLLDIFNCSIVCEHFNYFMYLNCFDCFLESRWSKAAAYHNIITKTKEGNRKWIKLQDLCGACF